MPKLSIDQVNLQGKRVLIRVDFNVPQDKTNRGRYQHGTHYRGASYNPIRARP